MVNNVTAPVKPHFEYPDLLELLKKRGMIIKDEGRALHKLKQVGYYRLSGFWYPLKQVVLSDGGGSSKVETFKAQAKFEDAYNLYRFDKLLRLNLLDAIERIEVYIRTVIAHEIGRIEPLAYLSTEVINPRYLRTSSREQYSKWTNKISSSITRCQDDFIKSHIDLNKKIPIWVAIETWDFGSISRFFSMLKGRYQNMIASRLGVDNAKVLNQWLNCINITRNRCAHHSRVWNVPVIKGFIKGLDNQYFSAISDTNGKISSRIFNVVLVMNYILRNIAPKSTWLLDVARLIDRKFPETTHFHIDSMGIKKGPYGTTVEYVESTFVLD